MNGFLNFLVENKGSISGYLWSLIFLIILLIILSGENIHSGYDYRQW